MYFVYMYVRGTASGAHLANSVTASILLVNGLLEVLSFRENGEKSAEICCVKYLYSGSTSVVKYIPGEYDAPLERIIDSLCLCSCGEFVITSDFGGGNPMHVAGVSPLVSKIRHAESKRRGVNIAILL